MARFKCCNLEAVDGLGEPVWVNLDLVKSIEISHGMGTVCSTINFLGKAGDLLWVSQTPEQILSGPTIDA
jgi:hypothetical protein